MRKKLGVIFVCYGNICRSPMAEFLFKNTPCGKRCNVSSAATSYEEEGAPVHYGTKKILSSLGIDCSDFSAHRLTLAECDGADYIIGMERSNVRDIKRICGAANEYKVYSLLDFTDHPRDIADPWYTHDFNATYRDITEGLEAFAKVAEERL